jgi:hypothetical protein
MDSGQAQPDEETLNSERNQLDDQDVKYRKKYAAVWNKIPVHS